MIDRLTDLLVSALLAALVVGGIGLLSMAFWHEDPWQFSAITVWVLLTLARFDQLRERAKMHANLRAAQRLVRSIRTHG